MKNWENQKKNNFCISFRACLQCWSCRIKQIWTLDSSKQINCISSIGSEGEKPSDGEYVFSQNIPRTLEVLQKKCLARLTDEERESLKKKRILKPGEFTKKKGASTALPMDQKMLIKKWTIQGEIHRGFFKRAVQMQAEMKEMKKDNGNPLGLIWV